MKSLHSVLTQIQSIVISRVDIDARGLAVYRIALGVMLLSDLALRARTITVFYTDAGVLPRNALTTIYPWVSHLSIHTVSGSIWYQSALFIIGGICAVGVIAGYRTRIAVILSWVLLVSLHARNPVVLNAGDSLLRRLLFWSIFLPLGRQWSVDAVKRIQNKERRQPSRITRVGSAGLLIQVILLYFTNGVLKLKNNDWVVGPVVNQAFQLDAYTTNIGVIVSQHPILLRIGGSVWVMMLLGSVVLLVTRHWNRVIVVGAYMIVHGVMAVTMSLGLFPLISITALIPFLPPMFWERITNKITNWKQQINRTKISAALNNNSLTGKVMIGLPEKRGSRRSESTWKTWVSWCGVCIGITILIAMVCWNAAAVGVINTPDSIGETLEPEDNSWDMFTSVSDENVWVIANAVTQQSGEVDLIRNETTQFTPPDGSETWYPTTRWRKYLYSITATDTEILINSTVNGVCRVHTNKPRSDKVKTVSLYEIREPVNTTNKNKITRNKIIMKKC